jgi:hypothetical protein
VIAQDANHAWRGDDAEPGMRRETDRLFIVLRTRSEMLRAPLATQNRSSSRYSSSESRTLIVRIRGIRTAIERLNC